MKVQPHAFRGSRRIEVLAITDHFASVIIGQTVKTKNLAEIKVIPARHGRKILANSTNGVAYVRKSLADYYLLLQP